MQLSKKDIPGEIVDALNSFNITQIEQFVSMTRSERMLNSLTSVLHLSKEEIKTIAKQLIKKYPFIKIPEPHGHHFSTGYRV